MEFKFDNLHKIVKYLVYLEIIVIALISVIATYLSYGKTNVFQSLGLFLIAYAFIIGIQYLFGRLCWSYATKKDVNFDIAFAIGWFTGLLGTILFSIFISIFANDREEEEE